MIRAQSLDIDGKTSEYYVIGTKSLSQSDYTTCSLDIMNNKNPMAMKIPSTLITEKAIQPKIAASKFSRKKHVPTPGDSLGIKPSTKFEPRTESEFCEQLLSEGFIQSYIDFYHLTHRPDPMVSDVRTSVKIVVPYFDMVCLRDLLVDAEVSRRRGNTMGVYAAYHKLANFYSEKSDWKTCIFFQHKYLDVAQLTADLRAEMASNHSLGLVYQQMGDFQTARIFHERHEEISMAVDVPEETAKANVELFKVYKGVAKTLDAEGLSEDAMNMYIRTLDASIKCWDKAAGMHVINFWVLYVFLLRCLL